MSQEDDSYDEATSSRVKQSLVEDTFKELFPEDYHAVVPVQNFQAVDELLRQWNDQLQVKRELVSDHLVYAGILQS